MELYLHSPNMSLWHGAYLGKKYFFMVWYLSKNGDKFTFYLGGTGINHGNVRSR
jgi:hypothetical protein